MPLQFLPTHHRSLRLLNFTAFGDATFEFVPGVNVLVGENGTGKTHALKVLYSSDRLEVEDADGQTRQQSLIDYFRADTQGEVIRNGADSASLSIPPFSAQLRLVQGMGHVPGKPAVGSFNLNKTREPRQVFIPAVDMIAHTRGYLALERDFMLDFDRTFGDLVSLLELPARTLSEPPGTAEMQTIQDRMGGTVEYDAGDKRFYLVTHEGRIAMPLVAEGLRKFATLHTLWKNGWLRPGTCLFWDEPEANLNPSLMDEAVAAILALARGGVQVFLATHSYVILKELEVQSTAEDSVRYFALEKTDGGTVVHPADRYLDLKPNLIEDQYASLFERALEKRLQEQSERV